MPTDPTEQEIEKFCETVMASPDVKRHIESAIRMWRADPGYVRCERVSDRECVYWWEGGKVSRCSESAFRALYILREESALPFEFCVMATVPSESGLLAEGPIDYLIMKI